MNITQIYDKHGSGVIISNGLFEKVLIRREETSLGYEYYTKYVKYPQGEWKVSDSVIYNEWEVINK